MPLDGQAKRDYQRAWIAARRDEYMAGRSCVFCSSKDSLEIDHANAEHKVSHRIWSWARPRLEAELAKCIVLCSACHQERHAIERRSHGAGGYKRGCRCVVCVTWKSDANKRQRRGRNSNPGSGLCRPVPNLSATAPEIPEHIDAQRFRS